MFEGKINITLRYLTENNDHGILPSTPETIKELKKKHLEQAKLYKDALLTGPTQKIPSTYFDKIDENLIQKAAKKTREEQDLRTLILNSFEEFFAISISKLKGSISENRLQYLQKTFPAI